MTASELLNFENHFRYTEDVMDDIGARLRAARKDRGWTLEVLASKSGLSTGFLSQVERDLTTLSIVSLSAICQALGVPIESLFSSSRPIGEAPSAVTRADQQLHIQIGASPDYLSLLVCATARVAHPGTPDRRVSSRLRPATFFARGTGVGLCP